MKSFLMTGLIYMRGTIKMKKIILFGLLLVLMVCSVSGTTLLNHDEKIQKMGVLSELKMLFNPLATYQDGYLCEDYPVLTGVAWVDTSVQCNAPRCHLLTYDLNYDFRFNHVMENGDKIIVSSDEVYELYECKTATRICGEWSTVGCGAGACDQTEMQFKEVCTNPSETNYLCVPQTQCREDCTTSEDCKDCEYCFNGGCVTDLTCNEDNRSIFQIIWDWLKSILGF
jgi:hypothetical protein